MPDWVTFSGVVTLGIALISSIAVASRWSGKVDTDRENFKTFMAEVKERLEKIDGKLESIFNRLGPAVAEGRSPIVLTDYGKELADKLGAYEFAAKLAPEVLPNVQGKEEFEVYEFCRGYFHADLDSEFEFDLFRRAYNAGISRDNARTVMTLVLRDELLKHLELGADD